MLLVGAHAIDHVRAATHSSYAFDVADSTRARIGLSSAEDTEG